MKNHFTHTLMVLLLATGTVFAQDYTSIIKGKLLSSRSSDGMTQQDLEGLTIYNQSTNRRSGVEHVYAIQKHNGIEVFNANVAVAFRGEDIIHVGDRLQSGLAARVKNTSPVLTPMQAATKAASLLGAGTANFSVLKTVSSQEIVLDKGGVSLDDVPVKLVYQLTEDNELRLAWDLNIHMLNEPHWYSVRLDAVSGEILSQHDWVVNCSFGDHSPKTAHTHSTKKNVGNSFGFNKEITNAALAGEQYNVFALPLENPNSGVNQIVVDPQDPDASPFGWHDTDGVEGAEFTITRGNNVWALEDLAADNEETIGMSPDGGEDLVFDFEYDFDGSPIDMVDATTTNLFYLNNVVHDVMYHYGFDEASGNFQALNYSGEGFGGDSVIAEAQAGLMNNACFATPPDSVTPRMQMFLWAVPGESSEETITLTGGNLDGGYVGNPGSFGMDLPGPAEAPLVGNLVLVEDDNSLGESTDSLDACDPIVNGADLAGNIVIIRRGTCQFGLKALAAEEAGAIGVIFVDNTSMPPIAPGPGTTGSQVTIPVIAIGMEDGEAIISALQDGESIEASIIEPDLPRVDSALDNLIVVHEYAHGVSSRLTAGPFAVSCVFNGETLTEGWSDYYGLMFTMTAEDAAEDARGIATYVSGEPLTGPGIRERPYSTDLTINDLTYGDVGDSANISFPHGIGLVWATMLWDMTWLLIDEYGFDADLYNGVAGNNISLQLVTDALKLIPCNAGLVDARDAIITAIEINTMIPEEDREEITCGIWGVFAQRGMGLGASQGNPFSRTDQIENFEAPVFDSATGSCVGEILNTDEFSESSFSVFPNPSNGQISLNMRTSLGKGQVQIIDLNGRVVFSQDSLLEGVLNIDASGLSTGVYLLQVSNQTVSETTKLIIK